MLHHCEALVIHCMDFRFVEGIRKYLNEQGLERNYDVVSIAGGAGALLNPESQALLLKQVALSQKLHGITKVILINHHDCGAYGGSQAFENGEAERVKHVADLKKAAEIIWKNQPQLTIELFLARLGDQKILFDSINSSLAA